MIHMRMAVLLSWVLAAAALAGAQTGGPSPAQPKSGASPAPAQTRRTAGARGGMAITVTDSQGTALPGVHVDATGPTDRTGDTNDAGRLNLPGLLAGNYRLKFSGESVITFEREVALRAGQVADIDVSLDPAPPPPPPPEPAPGPPPVQSTPAPGPKGQPITLGIVDLLEKDFVGRDPRRESLLSCSGNARSMMIQLNEAMPERLYDKVDAVYYVLGGEGSVTIDGRNSRLSTNSFVSVPRGVLHSFDRRGSRPLVLLAVYSGEPCERSK